MRERIKVITDSTADLPQEILERYDIATIPMHVIMNGKDIHDTQVDIDEIYQLIGHIQRKKELPITYSPRAPEIQKFYERLRDEGYTHIISIHISSKLSNMYENARQAAKNVPGVVIHVVDSAYASIALGLLAMRVAIDVQQGMLFNNIIHHIPTYIKNMRFLIKIRTLKLLEISGRLGLLEMYKNRDFNGGGLIVTMRGGILVPYEIISQRKMTKRIIQMMRAAYKPQTHIYLAYGGNKGTEKEYAPIINAIKRKYRALSSFEAETGVINLIHIGPASWAIAFLK